VYFGGLAEGDVTGDAAEAAGRRYALQVIRGNCPLSLIVRTATCVIFSGKWQGIFDAIWPVLILNGA
jgi:hypothetical protein